MFSTGVENGHEAPPVVVNGVMFVSTPGNQVLAINAKTGTLLWRYRRPLPTPVVLLHPTSRGVAVYDDKVYFAAGEAVLVALDAKTGEEVWTTHSRRQRERLLHVARAARRRREGADRHVGRRARHPRLCRRRSMRKPARSCGRPTWFPRPASRAAKPGRRATNGRPAAARCG